MLEPGIDLANVLPTFMKKLLNLLAMIFPSLMILSKPLNFLLTEVYFLLLTIPIIDFMTCQDFLCLIYSFRRSW